MARRRKAATVGDFDAKHFEKRFEQFLDDVMPDDDELITTDEMSDFFVKVREFLAAQHMPQELQIELAQLLLNPLLKALPREERIRLAPTWVAAFGWKSELLH